MKPQINGGERMDRTLLAVLAVLAVALVIFIAAFSVTVYVGMRYRSTFTGTYLYEVTIIPDAPLGNVTLYIPVPARGRETSPVAQGIGSGNLQGVPARWNTSLIGTEKFTMLEITARELDPGCGCAPMILSVNARSLSPVETREPATGDILLGTAGEGPVACDETGNGESPEMQCRSSHGQAYADFTAPEGATLTVLVSLTGRNSWDVFGPASNEYRDRLRFAFTGGDQGWHAGEGTLVTGIGDYRYAALLPKDETPGEAPVFGPELVT
jgi:hypothetical protein